MTDELQIARPGDTIIVRLAQPITAQDAEGYKQVLRSRLPAGVDVVVIQADGLMIVRPDPVDPPPASTEPDPLLYDNETGTA